MAEHSPADEKLVEARRLNRLVETDWEDRLERGLPPAGRAEQTWRLDRVQQKGGLIDG